MLLQRFSGVYRVVVCPVATVDGRWLSNGTGGAQAALWGHFALLNPHGPRVRVCSILESTLLVLD